MKYDGYQMMVIRQPDRVHLISIGRRDWARHFPLIVEDAKLRQSHFIIDGEAVALDHGGVSDFALRNRRRRGSPPADALVLWLRKANLDRLLSRCFSARPCAF